MDYDESEQTKFQMGVDLVSHMWHAGRKNIARTHSFFKLTFGILCVSSAIYMIGFVSPHWVVDDFDVHRDDVVDAAISNISVAGNSSNSTGADDNDNRHKPHGGVWEKCTVKGGKETCTVFVRDLDSVVAMLGCVGAALLVGACCWSGFVCVRKPRTSRYITTAIAAIIGGVFGLVCIFMFVGLQGRQSYSWGFALALAGSVLGLSAAAFTLLGIGKAMAAGLLPSGSEATLDNNANVIPEIVVTKATPRKRRTREKQQKSARKHRTSTRTMALSGAQALSVADRRESAVTLDMICPLPESKPKERKGRGSIAKSFSKSKLARRDTSDPQSFTAQLRRKSTPSSGKRQEVDFSRMDVFQPLIHFPSPQPPPELFLKSVDSADVGPNSKRRRSELRFDAEVYCHHLHNIDHSPARKPEKSDRRPRKFYGKPSTFVMNNAHV
ncbi:hypothetical protein BaRGS_00000876 [Batillaria attramentaria]|uniref:Transmembrane protein n=1 Tax=Batillaria attramentaria TaxID=370345 RepID=A0ABD0M8Z1_9CAEN